MCSVGKVQKTMRVLNAASTFGVSEGVRAVVQNNTPNQKTFFARSQSRLEDGPAKIYDYGAKLVKGKQLEGAYPEDSPPGDPIPEPPPPEPMATPAPGISTLTEQRRRKRLSSLRMGIMGNIRAGSDMTTANLLTPSASGAKTLLGQ